MIKAEWTNKDSLDLQPTTCNQLATIEALSAEAVEVVRCKDCKWHINGHLCKRLSQYGSIETPPSFYCGFGERKGGEDE